MKREDEIIGMAWTLTYRSGYEGDGRPRITPGHIRELIKLSRGLRRLGEHACNYGLSDAQRKRRDRMIVRGEAIAKEFGATAYIQGDPRGAAVYILFPGDIREGQTVDQCYTNGVAIY